MGAVAGKVGWLNATVALALQNLDETGGSRSFEFSPVLSSRLFNSPVIFILSHRRPRGVGFCSDACLPFDSITSWAGLNSYHHAGIISSSLLLSREISAQLNGSSSTIPQHLRCRVA